MTLAAEIQQNDRWLCMKIFLLELFTLGPYIELEYKDVDLLFGNDVIRKAFKSFIKFNYTPQGEASFLSLT